MNNDCHPTPFVKWAGGKRRLIEQMTPFFPSVFNDYFEPFVGGGAVFFALRPNKATLIDNNEILIDVYSTIKTNVEDLIEELKIHKNNHLPLSNQDLDKRKISEEKNKDYYYKIRNLDREPGYADMDSIKKAARLIYLNRTCFNGLFRVNSNNQFNVPFGRYKNPQICNEENLRNVSEILQNVDIIHGSYEIVEKLSKPGDFVYFDPPYQPLNQTSSFTSYTKTCFREEDQINLSNLFKRLIDKEINCALSNSYCDFILDLYSEFKIETIMAGRAINSNGAKRNKIKEVLIHN